MRHVRFRVLVACLPMVVALAACSQQSAAPAAAAAPAPAAAPVQPSIARGKVLVDASGCHDCHTPKKLGPNGPELDMTRLLSGHPEGMKVTTQFKPAPGSPWTVATNYALTAWSGPWGITYAANLTPDPNTGLRSGVWSEALFIKAIRTGKHMGTSRDILPPMPWQDFAQFSDEDLKDIWAYLGTIPAINNHVPDPVPPAAATSKTK